MLYTNGGNGGHDFTKLQIVQNSRLASCIQTNHQDVHFLFADPAGEQLGATFMHSLHTTLNGPMNRSQSKQIQSERLCRRSDVFIQLTLYRNNWEFFTFLSHNFDIES
ncbi:hypothetical protein BDR26DRAFT_490389 [Obelidium mucronatum]|nr:hypothetical protein BDR26DRAFT_490389 [Obelidium mucronatum]